ARHCPRRVVFAFSGVSHRDFNSIRRLLRFPKTLSFWWTNALSEIAPEKAENSQQGGPCGSDDEASYEKEECEPLTQAAAYLPPGLSATFSRYGMLPMSIVVYPPGYDTLPVRILTLMANGAPSLIAALCIILIAITIVPLGAAGLWFKLGANGGHEQHRISVRRQDLSQPPCHQCPV